MPTERLEALSSVPILAAVIPFPSELSTPPVTNINLVSFICSSFFGGFIFVIIV